MDEEMNDGLISPDEVREIEGVKPASEMTDEEFVASQLAGIKRAEVPKPEVRELTEEEEEQLAQLKARLPLMTKKQLEKTIEGFNELQREILKKFMEFEELVQAATIRLNKLTKMLETQAEDMPDDEDSNDKTNDEGTDSND